MKKKRWLYLPIEIPVREVDGKLLLAIHAANQGYHVVFGTKSLLRLLPMLPPGVLLYKSSHPDFVDFRKLGHRIVVHDEEGLVRLSEAEAYRRGTTASLEHVDLYLCWGQVQQAIIERAARDSGFNYPVVAVGHPRVDMLHARQQIVRRAPRDKPRILINTKLAEYNHVHGYDGWLDILVQTGVVRGPEDLRFRQRQRDYKERLFGHYLELIDYLAGLFPDCEIVLRPHPAEDSGVWNRLCSRFRNVVVTNSQSVVHWIRQSDITIHTACTTGIESALLGCPAVSYHPECAREFHSDLPDRVSLNATNREEVGALVAERIARLDQDQDKLEENGVRNAALEAVSGHIANAADGNSYVAIVSEMDRLEVPAARLRAVEHSKLRARSFARSVRRAIRPARFSAVLPTDAVRERIGAIEHRYGESTGVVMRNVASDVFIISPR